MILKGYMKNRMKNYKKYVKSYMHCSKWGLVTIWHIVLLSGVWFWEVLGMHLFYTAGANCEVVAAAG